MNEYIVFQWEEGKPWNQEPVWGPCSANPDPLSFAQAMYVLSSFINSHLLLFFPSLSMRPSALLCGLNFLLKLLVHKLFFLSCY